MLPRTRSEHIQDIFELTQEPVELDVARQALDAQGRVAEAASSLRAARTEAAARLLANRYGSQLTVTLILAATAAITGYAAAGFGPALFGSPIALSAAGMIAAIAGLILGIAAISWRWRRTSTRSR